MFLDLCTTFHLNRGRITIADLAVTPAARFPLLLQTSDVGISPVRKGSGVALASLSRVTHRGFAVMAALCRCRSDPAHPALCTWSVRACARPVSVLVSGCEPRLTASRCGSAAPACHSARQKFWQLLVFIDAQAAPQLTWLDISGAWLSAGGLAALRQLTRLDALSMDGTVQPADEAHYLAPLTRLTNLQVLRLPLICSSTRSASL